VSVRLRRNARVLVTGATGLVGRNLVRRLERLGCRVTGVGSACDLRERANVRRLIRRARPETLFHLAARVGGIYANITAKEAFYYDNSAINTNVVREAMETGVPYIFAMGTGCAYPKRLESSLLRERDYLDGVPETTNDAYAYAKRGLLVHLQAAAEASGMRYAYCLPANIYGPFDNFHPEHSHVVAGLVRRFADSTRDGVPSVRVWGDGSTRRDFLYIEDCIDAMLRIANSPFQGVVNVATGRLTTIRKLASLIALSAGYQGIIEFDPARPVGQTRRRFSTAVVRRLGWKPKIGLEAGVRLTCAWYARHRDGAREV